MTLIFNLQWAMAMTHPYICKYQEQKSVHSKDCVETNGRTMTDRVTFPANVVSDNKE